VGHTVGIQATRHAGHATELARHASAELVVAVGGDGTVNEVASGLLQRGSPVPTLAVLPAGTGNDIAQLLGVNSPAAAVAAMAHPRETDWDVIEIRCQSGAKSPRHHALLFAGAGFAAAVVRHTTPAVKARWGSTLSYQIGFLRALLGYRNETMRLRSEGREFHEPLLTALVANAPHAGGGGMRLGPGARMDDGVFDVSVIRGVTRLAVARQFVRLTRGTHIHHPAVNYFPGRWLEVASDRPLDVVADGELVGLTPVRFDLRPKALRLLAGVASA